MSVHSHVDATSDSRLRARRGVVLFLILVVAFDVVLTIFDGGDRQELSDRQWHDTAFRDPWVMPDPDGDGWHMLITARGNHGPADERAVVGHATSPDLRAWTFQPPLSQPGQGFGAMEVQQYEHVDGQGLLLFSASITDVSHARRVRGTTGGVWVARAAGPLGPYEIADAEQITDDTRYVGRLIQDRTTGQWLLLTFRNKDTRGNFIGEITDPEPFRLPAAADGERRAVRHARKPGIQMNPAHPAR